MEYTLVTNTAMTEFANILKKESGLNTRLIFPEGFISAYNLFTQKATDLFLEGKPLNFIPIFSCAFVPSYTFHYANISAIGLVGCSFIASYAFTGCSNLMSVYLFCENVVDMPENAFGNTKIMTDQGKIYVKSDLLSMYQNLTSWSFHSFVFAPY